MRLSPLRLSLLAAVLMHLLWLAAWQLQRSRVRPPQRLAAVDDTPLLLQFSRQEASESQPLSVPLPPASLLPPPIPSAPLTAAAANPAAPARRPAGSGAAQATRPRAPGPGVANRLANGRQAVSTTAMPAVPDLGQGSRARQALEKALREAAPAPSREPARAEAPVDAERDPQGPAGAEAGRGGERSQGAEPSGATAGQSAAAAAERRLWRLARPVRLTERLRQGLPKGVELRHLDLAQARRSGPLPPLLSGLRTDDRLVVIWIEGSSLWLLGAPVPGGTAPAGGAG